MTSDPRIGFWVCWVIAGLCAAWFAALAVDADGVWDALGDAMHAITFTCIFVGLTAVVVSFLFRRFVRVRDDLVGGRDVRGRWRVDRAAWDAFAGHAGEDIRADHNAILVTILVFDVVICAGLAAVHPRDAIIFAWIALGIAGVGLLGWSLGRWSTASQLDYRTGEVIIGDRGMLVNGALHVWDYFGSQLDGLELIDSERPRRLAVTYSYLARSGRQYATAYAPVPDDPAALAGLLAAPPKRTARRRRKTAGTAP